MSDMEHTITVRRPDVNSAEAIVYGDEYLAQKSSDWFWDAVEDELKKQLEKNKASVRDKEFAAMVLKTRPNMIFARNPPVSNFDQLKDLRTLKMCVRNGSALKDLEVRRKSNELYSRMKGIAQYTQQMYASGISDSTWKISTTGKNEPITYDSIRRLMDDDELKAEEDAREYAVELDAYKADREKFNQEFEAYKRAMEEGMDYVPPSFDEDDEMSEPDFPDIPIYREVLDMGSDEPEEEFDENGDMPDPNSDEYWGSEDDYDDDNVDGSYVPSLKEWDFINAPLHDRIQYRVQWWCADDVEWFLTEVLA